jgi:GAF domain-containing protein
MPVGQDRSISLLRAARAAASSARAIPEGLRGLATCLRTDFPVCRLSLRELDPAEERLRVRGVWSDAETVVGVGVSIPITSTSFLDLERAGRSLLFRWEELPEPPQLLDQVLHDEGLRAWVVVPLRRSGAIVGTLNVSSRRPDAFGAEDLPFFDDLAAQIEGPLLQLSDDGGAEAND